MTKMRKNIVKTPLVRRAIKVRNEVESRLKTGASPKQTYIQKGANDPKAPKPPKTTEEFPLIGEEKRTQQKLDVRQPKAPKKKLTSDVLDAIARAQGAKRKIYTKSEVANIDINQLYQDIKLVGDAIKKYKQGAGNREVIEKQLHEIIDKLTALDQSIESEKLQENGTKVIKSQSKVVEQDIYTKLQLLKQRVDKELKESIKTMVIRKSSQGADRCNDCGQSPCQCFIHLSKPILKTNNDGTWAITFGKDWDEFAIENYLRIMRYAPLKGKK